VRCFSSNPKCSYHQTPNIKTDTLPTRALNHLEKESPGLNGASGHECSYHRTPTTKNDLRPTRAPTNPGEDCQHLLGKPNPQCSYRQRPTTDLNQPPTRASINTEEDSPHLNGTHNPRCSYRQHPQPPKAIAPVRESASKLIFHFLYVLDPPQSSVRSMTVFVRFAPTAATRPSSSSLLKTIVAERWRFCFLVSLPFGEGLRSMMPSVWKSSAQSVSFDSNRSNRDGNGALQRTARAILEDEGAEMFLFERIGDLACGDCVVAWLGVSDSVDFCQQDQRSLLLCRQT
jgi:hypothetical protein